MYEKQTYRDQQLGSVSGGPSMPMRDMQASAVQPMSEVQYAAQQADDALRTLEKVVHELVSRLEPVLTAEPPQPATGPGNPARTVTSRMATALYTHAQQTEQLTRILGSTLNRLAL